MNGIIFDLDGTLTDTLDALTYYTNGVLRGHGLPEYRAEEYKKMVGWGMMGLVLRAVPEELQTEQLLRECEAELVKVYAQDPVFKTELYPGIPELLNGLSNLGIPKGILSNKADVLVKKIVKTLLSEWDFVSVNGSKEGTPKKPEPSVPLQVAAKLGSVPENTLFVGDSDVDMQTGTAAGMIPVGVLWGFRDENELLENGAQYIIRKPAELLHILQNRRQT